MVTRRKTTRKIQAKVTRTFNGKKYLLTKFAFSNKTAAIKTAQALRKVKRIKSAVLFKSNNAYLIYVRV